jgi:hypothetical protein
VGVDKVPGCPAAVLLAGPQGDQELDGLADQLLASVAKEPFGLCIYKDDLAGGIDHDHPLGCRLKQFAEQFGRPQPVGAVFTKSTQLGSPIA